MRCMREEPRSDTKASPFPRAAQGKSASKNQFRNRPEPALNHVLRASNDVHTLITHECRQFPGVKNRDPSRFRRIRRKNRPKRFQIENDSQRGYHSRQIASQTSRLRIEKADARHYGWGIGGSIFRKLGFSSNRKYSRTIIPTAIIA